MFTKRVIMRYPTKLVDKPIVSKLVKEFHLDFNILKASVTPNEEGVLVLELIGDRKNYNKAMDYLKGLNVTIQPFKHDIIRNEKKCTHCGACVVACPAEALIVETKSRKIIFDEKKCIACELCIPICPVRAMEMHY
ncbi:MAG: 4Fe-4S binding protein [Elusimicrobia bacterium]|nr:4Fe-4S binding protein [Elusimicrobiota bacterium]MBU2615422.1 4Fe-4S binding protein [Elusimicrobiota bacterium]